MIFLLCMLISRQQFARAIPESEPLLSGALTGHFISVRITRICLVWPFVVHRVLWRSEDSEEVVLAFYPMGVGRTLRFLGLGLVESSACLCLSSAQINAVHDCACCTPFLNDYILTYKRIRILR